MKNITILLLTFSTLTTYAQETPLLATAGKETTKEKNKSEAPAVEAEEAAAKDAETVAAFNFSGTIDTYFHSSFKNQNSYGDTYAPSTSFGDLKGFSLGMINLVATYAGEKAGFTADVVFGPRGQAAVFGTASGQSIINQAFAYYNFSDKVTLNLGQFNTFLGYEVISPAVNFHYSTSYLFSWGPFNHTGARLDFTFDNGMVAKLAVMNPTDVVEFDPVDTYTLGAQIGKTSDAGGIWFNFLYGDQDGTLDKNVAVPNDISAGHLFQADVTLGYDLTSKFYLGFNASMQQVATGEMMDSEGDIVNVSGKGSSFYGFAIYPKVTLTEKFSLGARAEYFGIKNNHLDIFSLDENGDGSVIEFTLSGNYKAGGLTFIPEIRFDKTSENSFYKDSNAKSILTTINLAAVYKF